MGIFIKGDNKGIAVDGSLSIDKVEFVLGQGVKTVSLGTHADIEDAECIDAADAPIEKGTASTASTARGPRKRVLFEDKETHKENTAVKNREKERFVHYLSEHRLKSRQLVCTKDDTLNQTVVCFLKLWIEHGIIGEHPSGAAVFRFLTEECGITSSVTERSYGNEMSERLKNIKTEYDTETLRKVKKCFDKK